MTPRRIGLTILFALWLSMQSLVVGMSPAWGYLIPHAHLTYGVVTESDWELHMQDHLRGVTQVLPTIDRSQAHGAQKAITSSIPVGAGALSISSWGDASLADALVKIPALNTPCAPLVIPEWFGVAMYYSPLDPPPNI